MKIVSLVDIPSAHILKGEVFEATTLGETALIEFNGTTVFLGSGEFLIRPTKKLVPVKQSMFKKFLKWFGL